MKCNRWRLDETGQVRLPPSVSTLQARSVGVGDRRGDLKGEDHLGDRVSFTKRRKRPMLKLPQAATMHVLV